MGTPTPGPGKFSQRTDKAVSEANRNLPNAGYGEQAAYQEQQQGADMAQSQDVTGMNFNDLFGSASDNVIPLSAETTMPDTPVTDGADAGPGAGSEVLSPSANQMQSDTTLKAYLPALEFMANQPASSDAARNLVRMLKAQS